MSFDLQLKGLRALVTGGTKGIGAAVVEGLRTAGVQVMATARSAPAQSTMDVTYVAPISRPPTVRLPWRGRCSSAGAALTSWSTYSAAQVRRAVALRPSMMRSGCMS